MINFSYVFSVMKLKLFIITGSARHSLPLYETEHKNLGESYA